MYYFATKILGDKSNKNISATKLWNPHLQAIIQHQYLTVISQLLIKNWMTSASSFNKNATDTI